MKTYKILLLIFFLLFNFLIFANFISKKIYENRMFPTKRINFPIDETIELPNIIREYTIPKNIYRTHKSPESIKNYQIVLDHTKNILPNYKTKIYFDKDCEKYIKNNFSKRIFDAYMSISPNYGPAKADFFRYLIIYKEGGIYLDIKSAPIKNLDNIINNLQGKMAISNWTNFPLKLIPILLFDPKYWDTFLKNPRGEYQNWYIISGKGNPLLGTIIKQIVTNIEIGKSKKKLYSYGKLSVLCLTGPLMFSKTIENYKNKDDYKYYKPNLNNNLKYKFVNHKTIEKSNHYLKNKNKCVLL